MTIVTVTATMLSGATKDQVEIVETLDSPSDGGIGVGFGNASNQRQVEIIQNLKQVARRVVESNKLAEKVSFIGEMHLGDGSGRIYITTDGMITMDNVAFIIVDGDYPFEMGSMRFNSDITTLLAALSDNYLKGV